MAKKWGVDMAKKLKRRLVDLEAADTLEDIRYLPGRCHELKGDLLGKLALDLSHPYRLIFKPKDNPVPRKKDGGLDWSKVTDIVVLDVSDYH